MNVRLTRGAAKPTKGRPGDAGYDFYLAEDVVIRPRKACVIATGVACELPEGYAGLFALRSSVCVREPRLELRNPLVDSNYRGELHLILFNSGFLRSVRFGKGERIASLYAFPCLDEPIREVESLSDSPRGEGWNGSGGR